MLYLFYNTFCHNFMSLKYIDKMPQNDTMYTQFRSILKA